MQFECWKVYRTIYARVSQNFEQIDVRLILNIFKYFGDNGDNFPDKRTVLGIFSYVHNGKLITKKNNKVRKPYSTDQTKLTYGIIISQQSSFALCDKNQFFFISLYIPAHEKTQLGDDQNAFKFALPSLISHTVSHTSVASHDRTFDRGLQRYTVYSEYIKWAKGISERSLLPVCIRETVRSLVG